MSVADSPSAAKQGELMNFTEAQKEAIGWPPGNLQLIACAGSGKTEVVAQRVAALLKTGALTGLAPRNIVAFTFTEKAAAELKDRIVSRVAEVVGEVHGMAEMYVGTIHGFCLDLLKTEVPEFLKYAVLDDVQQILFVNRHSKQSGLTASTDLNGTVLRRFIDTKVYIDALNILREARLVESKLNGCSVVSGLKAYQQLLMDRRYLDYSGIMLNTVKAIMTLPDLSAHLAARIKHVIVDEYQDVNPIQECVVNLLSKAGAHVCVVGDDDQTIYQWRGGDITNILTFEKRYSDVKPIRLEENFRSSQGIVETARDFIAQNSERLPKAMVATKVQPYEAGDICALSFDTPEGEAGFITETIKTLHGIAFVEDGKPRGLAYSDVAILLRSVKANGEPITRALRDAGIPAIVVGMNDLFAAPEAEAARLLFYFMAKRPIVDRGRLKKSWLDANLGITEVALDVALDNVESARAELGTPDQKRWALYSIQRQYREFLDTIGLREEKVPDGPSGAKRGEVVFYNLGKFSQVISDFEEIYFHSDPPEKYESFASFLQYQADGAYPEGWQEATYANPDAVRIMTIHQAKGMQWPVVFIPALLKNRFPSVVAGGKSVWHLIPADGVYGKDRFVGGLEDERRLFYVAMTRSQKFLFLTYAPVPGKNNRYAKKSPFWDDVLVSKHVKRMRPDYSTRARLAPEPKAGIANVVLSFSDLKYFFECPYQFKLRILYGFNPPIYEGLGYGKSLHDALADVHARAIKGETVDETAAPSLIGTHLHLPYAYKALRETLERSATSIVEQYIAKNKADFDKIEFSEKGIELHLGDGVSVVGRIDLVRRKDTNEVTVVDLKTAERSQAEDVTEVQLHIYALGYQELTGKRADFVEIYELEEQKRKPRSVDDDFISTVKQNVKFAATSLRIGVLPPKPKEKSCNACDFKMLCSEGCKFIAKAKDTVA
jgi:DNA helicase-2/ATP-dependent DNA helicase PcrA